MTDHGEQQPSPASEPPPPTAPTNDREEAPCAGDPTVDEPNGKVAPSPSEGRGRSRFWLDVATTLVFSAMVGSGTLLAVVLPPRGGGTWLGWTRHEWGDVHLWLGVALFALVVLHLVQHRQWFTRCWARFVGTRRSPLSWALLLATLALMAAPLLIPPKPGGGGGRQQRGAGARAADGAAARTDGHEPRRGGAGRATPRGERRWQTTR